MPYGWEEPFPTAGKNYSLRLGITIPYGWEESFPAVGKDDTPRQMSGRAPQGSLPSLIVSALRMPKETVDQVGPVKAAQLPEDRLPALGLVPKEKLPLRQLLR